MPQHLTRFDPEPLVFRRPSPAVGDARAGEQRGDTNVFVIVMVVLAVAMVVLVLLMVAVVAVAVLL
jgi:hypothetical protein